MTNKDSLPNLEAVLKTLSQLVIFLGGSAYFSGLIVVNLHLSRHGFRTLGFFENQYVLAGIWALIPLLVGALAASMLYLLARGGDLPCGLIVLVIFLGCIAGAILLLGVQLSIWWLGFVGIGLLLTFPLYLQTQDMLRALRSPTLDRAELFRQTNGFLFFLLLTPAYFAFFSFAGYPDIPQNLGGGATAQVRLLAQDAMRPRLEALGIPFTEEPQVSNAINLVMLTASDLLIALPDQNTSVIITRDLIDAIVFETP